MRAATYVLVALLGSAAFGVIGLVMSLAPIITVFLGTL